MISMLTPSLDLLCLQGLAKNSEPNYERIKPVGRCPARNGFPLPGGASMAAPYENLCGCTEPSGCPKRFFGECLNVQAWIPTRN